jgi:anti-sigma factor RsiW
VTGPDRLIAEDEIHAYVDNQLDPEQRAEVERLLATDHDSARLVAAYQAQREALRAAFAPAAAEPLPERLTVEAILRERRRSQTALWRIAAAIVLALGLGGASGWLVRGQYTPSRETVALELLEQQALTSHAVYAADRRHPIEVPVAEEAHLRQWLSNRLGRKVDPPDLSAVGYHLIGGRLLATEHGGASALFMYDDNNGKRLSLLFRPMSEDLAVPYTDVGEGEVKGCAWIEKGMGYAVVAALPDSDLDRIARHIWTELGTG